MATDVTDDIPTDAELLTGLSDDRGRRQTGTLPYLGHVARLDALERALRAADRWRLPHPWLTTFVGDSAVEAVVADELDRLDPVDLGLPFGQVVLSPIRRRAVTTPMLRLPVDELCHAFNLVRFPATDDVAEIDRLVAAKPRHLRAGS